jgi:hypothetical protein
MWGPNEPVEEDVADPPGIDPQSKRRRSAAPLGVTGLLTKRPLRLLKMFGPTERSSAPSSAVLTLDPCWSSRSFIDSQACCGDFVVPARSKPACLRSRANV